MYSFDIVLEGGGHKDGSVIVGPTTCRGGAVSVDMGSSWVFVRSLDVMLLLPVEVAQPIIKPTFDAATPSLSMVQQLST